MRFIQYLNEEYVATASGQDAWDKNINFPIYKNPNSNDYKELTKAAYEEWRRHGGKYNSPDELILRAIVDLKNKNIFVWDGTLGVHIQGFNALKKSGDIKVEKDSAYNIFCGSGTLRVGSSKMRGGDEYLSFLAYIRYYGLTTDYEKEGSLKELEKKAAWIKSYYTNAKIKTELGYDGPKILVL